MTQSRTQHTLARPVSVRGIGYWSGQEVRVEFRPAPLGEGRYFVRDDLPEAPRIAAHVSQRSDAQRRTVLAAGDAKIEMVEHVLAALAGLEVDNCEIGVTSSEMPGCDGSAAAFVDAIQQAGLRAQPGFVSPIVIDKPIRCGDERKWIEARPPLGSRMSIEYGLDYGPGSAIGAQWLVTELEPMAFTAELAPARTFLLKAEADALTAQGLGGHVTPQDLLIFGLDGPIDNPLRYDDECVRHKMLDVVGDLSLAGRPILGHIVACRSGHQLNGQLVAEILANVQDSSQRRSA
jgi:UDP-3-O-acyl N-acetylglucosamine deacetylase